jgi:hypothetical protein
MRLVQLASQRDGRKCQMNESQVRHQANEMQVFLLFLYEQLMLYLLGLAVNFVAQMIGIFRKGLRSETL